VELRAVGHAEARPDTVPLVEDQDLALAADDDLATALALD